MTAAAGVWTQHVLRVNDKPCTGKREQSASGTLVSTRGPCTRRDGKSDSKTAVEGSIDSYDVNWAIV